MNDCLNLLDAIRSLRTEFGIPKGNTLTGKRQLSAISLPFKKMDNNVCSEPLLRNRDKLGRGQI